MQVHGVILYYQKIIRKYLNRRLVIKTRLLEYGSSIRYSQALSKIF